MKQLTPSQRVAAAVRAGMRRHRITQHQLAGALGVSQAAVGRRLTGEVAFDVDELTAIAPLLGTTASSLIAAAA